MVCKIAVGAILGFVLVSGGCQESLSDPPPELGVNRSVNDIERTVPAIPSASSTPVRKDKKMNENSLTQVKLNAKAEIVGKNLNVSYEAENLSNEDVYLWDGMIGFDGPEKVVDHDRAYVFFEEPNTVRLIRANLPLPTTFKVGVKQILFARLLKARSNLSAKFSLLFPVREHSPYYEPMKEDEQELKKCSKIRLLVAWTLPKAGMKIDERDINGEKWFKIRGVWDPPYQEVLEQFIPLETELLTYTTPFERQVPLR